MTKKKKSIVPKEFAPSFTLAGVSIGSFLFGSALDSRLPAGTTNPLTAIGTSAATFVGPAVAIGGTGFVLKHLKKLDKDFKKSKGGK